MTNPRFQVGDVIKGTHSGNSECAYLIIEVRPTGYTWRYADFDPPNPGYSFDSENSNDPFFERGWEGDVKRDADRAALLKEISTFDKGETRFEYNPHRAGVKMIPYASKEALVGMLSRMKASHRLTGAV